MTPVTSHGVVMFVPSKFMAVSEVVSTVRGPLLTPVTATVLPSTVTVMNVTFPLSVPAMLLNHVYTRTGYNATRMNNLSPAVVLVSGWIKGQC